MGKVPPPPFLTVWVGVITAHAQSLRISLDVFIVQFDPQRPAQVRLSHGVLQPPPGVRKPVGNLHRCVLLQNHTGFSHKKLHTGTSLLSLLPALKSCASPEPAGPSLSWWGRGCRGACTANVSVAGPCPAAPASCGELWPHPDETWTNQTAPNRFIKTTYSLLLQLHSFRTKACKCDTQV